MSGALFPWQRVRISGPSMSPTLRDGDVVIVRHGRAPRIGDLVLARYRSMPDRPVVKRVVHRERDGWWLASDNPMAGGDSTVHGIADVDAVVVLRVWRKRR
ncbi:MAG TPA: S24 family peptidase [Jatrophihabitantaceae bacterium]|nr:S24 family peptidase [Jatrophihabitantaceae bacterium]